MWGRALERRSTSLWAEKRIHRLQARTLDQSRKRRLCQKHGLSPTQNASRPLHGEQDEKSLCVFLFPYPIFYFSFLLCSFWVFADTKPEQHIDRPRKLSLTRSLFRLFFSPPLQRFLSRTHTLSPTYSHGDSLSHIGQFSCVLSFAKDVSTSHCFSTFQHFQASCLNTPVGFLLIIFSTFSSHFLPFLNYSCPIQLHVKNTFKHLEVIQIEFKTTLTCLLCATVAYHHHHTYLRTDLSPLTLDLQCFALLLNIVPRGPCVTLLLSLLSSLLTRSLIFTYCFCVTFLAFSTWLPLNHSRIVVLWFYVLFRFVSRRFPRRLIIFYTFPLISDFITLSPQFGHYNSLWCCTISSNNITEHLISSISDDRTVNHPTWSESKQSQRTRINEFWVVSILSSLTALSLPLNPVFMIQLHCDLRDISSSLPWALFSGRSSALSVTGKNTSFEIS